MQMIRKIIPLALVMVVVNLFLPWWGFTLLAVSSAWCCQSLKESMLVAARASVLSWVPLLIYTYISGGDILFGRVSQMMGLPYPFLLILSSGILVALLGTLSGFTGFNLKDTLNGN